ncbi:HNH endonuclease [Candidatus Micrarchaeota archaeon]|nr:HNH endonuclease [Candidatus Micrarchaeota archaeon]
MGGALLARSVVGRSASKPRINGEPLLDERKPTVSVTASSRITNMIIKTPKYCLTHIKFRQLGFEKLVAISRAITYVERNFASGKGMYKECAIILGDRNGKSRNRREIEATSKKCFCCNSRDDLTNHHIVPVSRNGADCKENIVRICSGCHAELETRISRMEQDSDTKTCYLDYIAILVVFELEKMNRTTSSL